MENKRKEIQPEDIFNDNMDSIKEAICEHYFTSGYSHVVPDSQSFTELEQILQYVKTKYNDEYLQIALQNTINNGYKLIK